jgi:ketosteroid isomerase-like protein
LKTGRIIVTTEINKAIVLDWMRANVMGDIEKSKSHYAPDCRFLVAGDMPYCGWMDLEGFYRQATILPLDGPITLEIGNITAEGDQVWFEAQSFGTLQGGTTYDNFYVFFVRLRAGKIIEYKEFIDTYYVNRIIDSPATRGTPKPRYRIFETPTARFTGGSLSGALPGEDISSPPTKS